MINQKEDQLIFEAYQKHRHGPHQQAKAESKKLAPIDSLWDLKQKAKVDEKYAKLAMAAASNLGGNPKDLQSAFQWLDLNAMESGSEEGVVDEINFCRDLIKEATDETAPRSVDEINKLINQIFDEVGIHPECIGPEAFWNAVEDIAKVNLVAAKRLRQLGTEWEKAFAKENIVKPNQQPPIV